MHLLFPPLIVLFYFLQKDTCTMDDINAPERGAKDKQVPPSHASHRMTGWMDRLF